MLTIARTLMGNPTCCCSTSPPRGWRRWWSRRCASSWRTSGAAASRSCSPSRTSASSATLGDRVYILEKGMVRYQGSMAEFLADEQVRQAYLAV
jgi:branched-chain amino acid transport system ATP-binding protein